MNHLATADYVVFGIYLVVVVGYGYWVYQRKRAVETNTNEFFLAEGSLTWWAIGASLIASNISAEHFIGMAGSGFAMGLAISSYEWIAAATLVLVAVFFIPIYLRNRIYTMPQFLAQRYSDTVSTILAVFWLVVYVLVNLTSILYLGAIAIESLAGISFTVCTIGLAVFAIFITLGGMKVIGYTDVIQVVVLIFGGLVVTYLALQLVAEQSGTAGVWNGLLTLREQADDHFHLYFSKGHPHYDALPGMSLVLGGMWLNNLYYWGCNQYIVQRTLGADLKTARSGILFAAFLKLMIPLIVVIPGIAAYVLYQSGPFRAAMTDASGVVKPDQAYPVLMNLLPVGMKGLAFAALTAAVVASLAGKCNSISTIFTLDIYKKYINKTASEQKLVNVGRWTVLVSFVIAVAIAPMLRSLDQVYQYIQEYTNFITPGVFAIFLLGFFWKRATNRAAMTVAILTIPLSILLKFWPEVTALVTIESDPIPFLHRTTWVFCIDVALMIVVSLTDPTQAAADKGVIVERQMFRVSRSFVAGSVLIFGLLAVLYSVFW
ncbi:sodium/sugar symporter [Spirosoma utsteinense]|uniref:SSS family solute:Na+ symporter n=1 Tax=Spirosoma utsteinense TaxID=2585773 RepID=A0ABR6W2G6_9BACT|nr:sodium/sugar symporter [Spirosoma utsteinense]MBC3783764.1 SSS family solute:Na+ symporter [Spirosoma utsteinense]MBC3790092.1 SSS family solute:Na+ symporter [Spirosoma utsteinense]